MENDWKQMMESLEEDRAYRTAKLFLRCAIDFLEESLQGKEAVSPADTAEELWRLLQTPIPESGRPTVEILQDLQEKILPYSIRLHHPRYMGHQVSAPLPCAVWTESLIGVLNQSVAVREMSPMGTLVETLIMRWMTSLIGMNEEAGGVMTSGGTEATYTALLTARNTAYPQVWKKGMDGLSPVIVCGEHAHYSVERAAGQLGIGTGNCIRVPSCDFRMDETKLEKILVDLQGSDRTVIAVVATAGTTATGSFDKLEVIGTICRDKEIWFHVDGAHGASAVFSSRRRHLLNGIEFADSVSWDPHKMMLMPLSAGMVLFRQEEKQQKAFSQSAPYLFHGEGRDRLWDQGTRSFQCSRRFDALKLWVALQRYGKEGFGRLYDHLCDLSDFFYQTLAVRNDFQTFHRPESNILCFRFLGNGMTDENSLNDLNQRLRQLYNAKGNGWLTLTKLNGQTVLRSVIMNPYTRNSDIEEVITELATLGASLRQCNSSVEEH